MEDDWRRVGEAIAARMAELSLTVAEVDRQGISDKTIKGYMAGQPIRRADKRRTLCEILGWSTKSIDLLLEGGEPEVVASHLDEIQELRAEVAAQREDLARLAQTIATLDKYLRDAR